MGEPSATRKQTADIVSLLASLVVFAGGLVVVVWPSLQHHGTLFADPWAPRTTTTRVEKTAGSQTDKPKVATTVTGRAAGDSAGGGATTTVTERAGIATEVTKTTAEADLSLIERGLGTGGLLLLRLGLVAMAAFLAGAVIQRTILGRFAIELGPVKVPELSETAEAAQGAITTARQGLEAQIREVSNASESGLKEQRDTTGRALGIAADALRVLDELNQRVAKLERAGRRRSGS